MFVPGNISQKKINTSLDVVDKTMSVQCTLYIESEGGPEPCSTLRSKNRKSKSNRSNSTSEPAERSRVKFAPEEGIETRGGQGGQLGGQGGQHGGLDAEALNLTRNILSTNTNDRKEGDEIGAKTNGDSVSYTHLTLPTKA